MDANLKEGRGLRLINQLTRQLNGVSYQGHTSFIRMDVATAVSETANGRVRDVAEELIV